MRVDQVLQHALDSQAGRQDQRCRAIVHTGVQVRGPVPDEDLDDREALRLGRQESEAAGLRPIPGNRSAIPQSPSWGLCGPSQHGRREECRKGGTPPATAGGARGRGAGCAAPTDLSPRCPSVASSHPRPRPGCHHHPRTQRVQSLPSPSGQSHAWTTDSDPLSYAVSMQDKKVQAVLQMLLHPGSQVGRMVTVHWWGEARGARQRHGWPHSHEVPTGIYVSARRRGCQGRQPEPASRGSLGLTSAERCVTNHHVNSSATTPPVCAPPGLSAQGRAGQGPGTCGGDEPVQGQSPRPTLCPGSQRGQSPRSAAALKPFSPPQATPPGKAAAEPGGPAGLPRGTGKPSQVRARTPRAPRPPGHAALLQARLQPAFPANA